MHPPNQIPNRKPRVFERGDTVYLWTGHRYSEKTFVTQHDWRSAMTLQDGLSQLIADPLHVISAEQFYEEQREEARERYAQIIAHWNRGLRTSQEIAPLITNIIGELVSVRGCGQMIAAAKRWNLLSDEKPPTD